MIVVELITKIIEFSTDIILKMDFQENVLTKQIFKMAFQSKMHYLCKVKQ